MAATDLAANGESVSTSKAVSEVLSRTTQFSAISRPPL